LASTKLFSIRSGEMGRYRGNTRNCRLFRLQHNIAEWVHSPAPTWGQNRGGVHLDDQRRTRDPVSAGQLLPLIQIRGQGALREDYFSLSDQSVRRVRFSDKNYEFELFESLGDMVDVIKGKEIEACLFVCLLACLFGRLFVCLCVCVFVN